MSKSSTYALCAMSGRGNAVGKNWCGRRWRVSDAGGARKIWMIPGAWCGCCCCAFDGERPAGFFVTDLSCREDVCTFACRAHRCRSEGAVRDSSFGLRKWLSYQHFWRYKHGGWSDTEEGRNRALRFTCFNTVAEAKEDANGQTFEPQQTGVC